MLADDLKKAIQASGYSLYRVAQETTVDPTVLGRFMAGKRTITIETAGKLAKFLGLRLTKTKAKT
ncbi:MAG: helix-turn-helix domain-containing protein [Pirellulales bacterium]